MSRPTMCDIQQCSQVMFLSTFEKALQTLKDGRECAEQHKLGTYEYVCPGETLKLCHLHVFYASLALWICENIPSGSSRHRK